MKLANIYFLITFLINIMRHTLKFSRGLRPRTLICFARSARPLSSDQRGIDGENQIPRQPDEKKNTVPGVFFSN